MKRIVSGITPSGDLTLGNYIGAIKNFVKLQNEYEMFIFVADLHAITAKKVKPESLRKNIKNIMALYIACGLDLNKVHLFVQSDIPEHANLGHLLLTLTSVGELQRMTQFKDKAQKQTNSTVSIPTGLLTYPTLMAADILLYDPDLVPVGKDQKQHIELTRNISQRFNNAFGKTFVVPEPFISQTGSTIKDLTNPTKKMSKSSKKEKSLIKLLDNPEVAYKKIMSAVTDSENKVYYNPATKPGISNLIVIYAELKDIEIEKAENLLKDMNYKELKNAVGLEVKGFLEDLQNKYNIALKQVKEVRKKNATIVNEVASKKYKEVKQKMGFC